MKFQRGQTAFDIGDVPRFNPCMTMLAITAALVIGAVLAWAPTAGSLILFGAICLLPPSFAHGIKFVGLYFLSAHAVRAMVLMYNSEVGRRNARYNFRPRHDSQA